MNKPISFILLVCFILAPKPTFSCTIVSAISSNGHVWNANNEDGPYGIANFINVFPKTDEGTYGYYTLSYFSPALGHGGSIQGGMNEAGLAFDFNAIDRVMDFDSESRRTFPRGDDAILPHILATMSSVEEVVEFFSTYWFEDGFMSAQMHVADKEGNFAIISASGIKLAESGEPLVSTNFDICGGEDGSYCWRYPIANSILAKKDINLETMKSICVETAQKDGSTMYSNIQNLTTGDIWFFSKHDPNTEVNTNISDMLSKGRKSYTFSDLKSLIEDRPDYQWHKPNRIQLPDSLTKNHAGIYHNSLTGNVIVDAHEQGLELHFMDGTSEIFYAHKENEFFVPDADVFVEFYFDKEANEMAINLYENGFWAFRAWKTGHSF